MARPSLAPLFIVEVVRAVVVAYFEGCGMWQVSSGLTCGCRKRHPRSSATARVAFALLG